MKSESTTAVFAVDLANRSLESLIRIWNYEASLRVVTVKTADDVVGIAIIGDL